MSLYQEPQFVSYLPVASRLGKGHDEQGGSCLLSTKIIKEQIKDILH